MFPYIIILNNTFKINLNINKKEKIVDQNLIQKVMKFYLLKML